MAYKDLINMQTNWGSFLPGGKPFRYNAANPTAANIYGQEYDTSTWQPIVDQTQDARVVPTMGSHVLHPRATERYNEQNAATRDLIEKNPDQLGTITNTGQVNKMSAFPDISNINWSGILQGGKNIFSPSKEMVKDRSWYDNITFLNNNPFLSLGRIRNPMLPKSFHQNWSEMGSDTPIDDIQVTETETIDPYTSRNMQDIAGEAKHSFITPDKKSFNFPSILNMATEGLGKFRDKFLPTMSPEKRAEVAAIQGSADQYGWGNLPGTGLQGNIWSGGSGGDKVFVRDPATGTLIVRDKNLQSAFGSNSIAEMLQKKEDWAGGQFEKYGDTWTDKDHKGISEALYNYYKSTGALQNWQKAAINEPVDTTAVDNMIIDGGGGGGGGGGATGPRMEQSQYDDYMAQPGRDLGHGMTIEDRSQIADTWAQGGRVRFDEGGWGGDESWGEPSSHDFSNDIGSVGDTGSSDAHDFSNDIGDVGNQGYTPPTPDESGLGDIGNINPYRGPSQIDNTDRINTALGNANAASQLRNFTTTGNVTDLFKPNLPILGMSYLYDQWKNRNNKEEEQTSLYDPSINNLVTELSAAQQSVLDRPDVKFSYGENPNKLIENLLSPGSGFKGHDIKGSPATKEDIKNWYKGTYKATAARGGRIGYFDGGIAGLL